MRNTTAPRSPGRTKPSRPSGHRGATTARAALFDVDQTLVQAKTMVEFWRFWTVQWLADRTPEEADRPLRRLLALPRQEANLGYYRMFRGTAPEELAAAGRAWFADFMTRGDTLLPGTLRELQRHRARGDRIVLVSGSLHACLDPLARLLTADVLCTEQEVGADGRFTGRLDRSVVGPGRLRTVRAALRAWGIESGHCSAYADHETDLELLHAVGDPVVVGDDPVLRAVAGDRGWRRLPGTVSRPRPAAPVHP
ncbi:MULTISPECIES: HAD family hydrolase [unclassified Streptomyces]|uniref:HAD family hydrolase n=1 Tax=unclassified Streptomyces TaxID=2593676 RepID=UPI0035DDDEA5